MKKIINCLIIVIVLILFIPTIKAAEVTTTYTNYYFFLEPFKQNDIKRVIEDGKTTTNYTVFPIEAGNISVRERTQVDLKRKCNEGEGNCWTYDEFYKKYLKIEGQKPAGENSEFKMLVDETEKDTITSYYLHGTYCDLNENKWTNPHLISSNNNQITSKLVCASLDSNNASISSSNNRFNDCPCNYQYSDNDLLHKKVYIKIERNINIPTEIKWEQNLNSNFSNCKIDEVVAYEGNVYSPVLYKYEYTVTENKCDVKETKKEMSCNDWTNLSSTCNKLTVKNGNSIADVKIVQNGYISNIFESNLVNTDINYDASSYDGGWLKYGIIYYNEVSWELLNLSQGDENEIKKAMQDRLKDNFEENLTLTINGLDGSRLIKKCTESGTFTDGSKLVTTCTFFLPESFIKDNNGKVYYSESNDNTSINNKYYIPFNEKEHSVSVTLTGLSRLSENKAVEDSAEKDKAWIGDWTISTKCNLKVINRLQPSKYKFTYRPIDLSNPFPNRSPGVNWYSWYIIENNKGKKTLEDSYKNLEYYTQLDNKTISEIKKYNKENTYFGEVDENFFKTYIKEGGNS